MFALTATGSSNKQAVDLRYHLFLCQIAFVFKERIEIADVGNYVTYYISENRCE